MTKNYKQQADLERIEKISQLLDSKFNFPGTKFKFGLDPILGLVPIVGDVISFAFSSLLVLTMAKYGVSRKVIILMMINISIDALFGGIPILGNIFDFFYKANLKNLQLLKEHYSENKYQGSGNGILFLIVVIFMLIIAFIIWGLYHLLKFIFELI